MVSGWTVLWVVLMSGAASRTAKDEVESLSAIFEDRGKEVEEGHVLDVGLVVKRTLDVVRSRLSCDQSHVAQHCTQCFDETDLLSVLDPKRAPQKSAPSVEHLSCVVLGRIVSLRTGCGTPTPSDCSQLALRLVDPTGQESFTDRVRILLRQLRNLVLEQDAHGSASKDPSSDRQCFGEDELTEVVESKEEMTSRVGRLARLVLLNFVFKGKCVNVESAAEEFLWHIFTMYGDKNGTLHLDIEDVQELLADLKRGPSSHREQQDPHDHDHHHHHHDLHHHHHEKRDRSGQADSSAEGDHSRDLEEKTGQPKGEGGKTGLMADDGQDQSSNHSLVRRRRHPGHGLHENHTHKADKCLDVDELLEHFGFKGYVTESEFMELCPALVQQAVSGVCSGPDEPDTTKKLRRSATAWERYGYSTIAVLVISLTSLVVVVILPFFRKDVYQYLMMCLIGLAFGTMAGDALLHLIPQGLGLHSHGDEEEDHEGGDESVPGYLWRQLGVLGAVYGIYMFQALMEALSGQGEGGHHGHSHSADPSAVFNGKTVTEKSISSVELTSWNQSSLTIDARTEDNKAVDGEPIFKSPVLCCGMRSTAWVITLGDAIHNFGDGLAIGAAFSASIQSGISTSIAVLCHELPHEFGDFVVLLSTGLSFRRALVVNFLSALTCFVGLYIGIAVGSDESTRLWIMVVTAGIFLYVALTEMLPELKHNTGSNKVAMFFVKNFGIIVGIGSMVVIALYEDKLHFL